MGFQSFETMVRYGRLLQVHMLSVESMRSKISPAFVLRGVDLLPTGAFRRDGGGGAAARRGRQMGSADSASVPQEE